jgi:hypothetical protein
MTLWSYTKEKIKNTKSTVSNICLHTKKNWFERSQKVAYCLKKTEVKL